MEGLVLDKVSVIKDITITPIEIGRGSFGVVYVAKYNGKPCVVKEIHSILIGNNTRTSVALQTLHKEISTLSSLRHPSIVQFYGVYLKDGIPLLVMEKLWKNLCTILEEQPNQLPLLIKTHILHDVACGLQYLHGQEKLIVHRDITATNVLLNENLEAKIADLGLAKVIETSKNLTVAPGNPCHMPPEATEVIVKLVYNEKLDIFSFSCVIIHLITEKFPVPTDQFVQSHNRIDKYKKVSEIDRRRTQLDKMSKHSPVLHSLTLNCLQNDPAKRPAASQVCNMLESYIHDLENEFQHLAANYKQDKLALVQSLQSYQMKEPNLEQQLLTVRAECERIKLSYQNEHQEKESLQSQLVEEKELVHNMKSKIKNRDELCKITVKHPKDDLLTQSKPLLADCICMLSGKVIEQADEIKKLKNEGKGFTSDREEQTQKILSSIQQQLSSIQKEISSHQQQEVQLTTCSLQEDNDNSDNESYSSAVEYLQDEINDEVKNEQAPAFTEHPSSVTVNLESDSMDVSLTCVANGATSYEWQKQCGVMPPGATGVNTNTLTIVNLQLQDAGNYRCLAFNENENSNSSRYATIAVKGPLSAFSRKGNQTTCTSQPLMEIIVTRSPEMRKYISITVLYPYLNKYKILASDERQKLLSSQATQEEKVDFLVQILEGKSNESTENFLKALKEAEEHTGHEALLKILETDRSPK